MTIEQVNTTYIVPCVNGQPLRYHPFKMVGPMLVRHDHPDYSFLQDLAFQNEEEANKWFWKGSAPKGASHPLHQFWDGFTREQVRFWKVNSSIRNELKFYSFQLGPEPKVLLRDAVPAYDSREASLQGDRLRQARTITVPMCARYGVTQDMYCEVVFATGSDGSFLVGLEEAKHLLSNREVELDAGILVRHEGRWRLHSAVQPDEDYFYMFFEKVA